MPVSGEEKRRVIDLHFNQGKTIREISRIMGKSTQDITPVTMEHRIQLAKNYALANGEQSDIVQREQDRVIPNVKAYKLFEEGKISLEVAAELNLPGPQVQQFYVEYLNMMRMQKLVTIYQETQDSIGYFLKLFRLGKEKGVTPEQIMSLIQMADGIHKLQDKLGHLQSEVLDITRSKSVGQKELKNLHNEISNTKEKLDLVKKTFNVKYEELKEGCSQAQKLQNYVVNLAYANFTKKRIAGFKPRFENGLPPIQVAKVILEAVSSKSISESRYLVEDDAFKLTEIRKSKSDKEFRRLVMEGVLK